ncbi:Cytidine and deoxycytidylate deaminase zinc-binding region [Carpediemonas membranifera]|uniref:Cytidine and deoxycytidylate deaminase zinc-binding region n=1 Tax=Carpediemonas membranifera TaxID=201153 RepID=A0A8J6AZ38_9EUKA|nr:Cytidine and deoxycytidylate deaminase zinc-binding region [Carpediemonas membranifera]|eukprot:KAG9390784.1 Cytidine and deoxycytidylate deaminase zinc-binding region [Carpediemonas membranifera]
MEAASSDAEDFRFMREALRTAAAAFNEGEVPVGCVIVRDGEIVSRAHNDTNATMNATRHAEFVAIDSLPPSVPTLEGCTLYVTIEPCVMCASALMHLKLSRCVFGAPNAKFGGCGSVFDLPADVDPPAYTCKAGVLGEEAIQLLRAFYVRGNEKAPKPHRRVGNTELPDVIVELAKETESG